MDKQCWTKQTCESIPKLHTSSTITLIGKPFFFKASIFMYWLRKKSAFVRLFVFATSYGVWPCRERTSAVVCGEQLWNAQYCSFGANKVTETAFLFYSRPLSNWHSFLEHPKECLIVVNTKVYEQRCAKQNASQQLYKNRSLSASRVEMWRLERAENVQNTNPEWAGPLSAEPNGNVKQP